MEWSGWLRRGEWLLTVQQLDQTDVPRDSARFRSARPTHDLNTQPDGEADRGHRARIKVVDPAGTICQGGEKVTLRFGEFDAGHDLKLSPSRDSNGELGDRCEGALPAARRAASIGDGGSGRSSSRRPTNAWVHFLGVATDGMVFNTG